MAVLVTGLTLGACEEAPVEKERAAEPGPAWCPAREGSPFIAIEGVALVLDDRMVADTKVMPDDKAHDIPLLTDALDWRRLGYRGNHAVLLMPANSKWIALESLLLSARRSGFTEITLCSGEHRGTVRLATVPVLAAVGMPPKHGVVYVGKDAATTVWKQGAVVVSERSDKLVVSELASQMADQWKLHAADDTLPLALRLHDGARTKNLAIVLQALDEARAKIKRLPTAIYLPD
jgi:hypothetical protein